MKNIKKMKRIVKTLLLVGIVFFVMGLAACSAYKKDSANRNSGSEMDDLIITDVLDFVVNVEQGRDVRILQISDTQIIDNSQIRYDDRLFGGGEPATDENLYKNCFKYIEQAVQKTTPDLILFTGDVVYGEFDDNGTVLTKIIAYMESLDISWAPVFGNHDNESKKGATWQCQQFENAENCLFKQGDLTGNGNYNIGIMQGEKLVKVIYMMDSNGCGNAYRYGYVAGYPAYNQGETVETSVGFGEDQLTWLDENSSLIDGIVGYEVSKFVAFHIPIAEFAEGAYEAGYQSDDNLNNAETYTIGKTVEAKNGDFGCKGEMFKGCHYEDGLWEILKENGFDGVFVGHSHQNNVSILYDGIRLTFGLKTGTYDRYVVGQLGGTLIEVEEGGATFSVKHIYYEEAFGG